MLAKYKGRYQNLQVRIQKTLWKVNNGIFGSHYLQFLRTKMKYPKDILEEEKYPIYEECRDSLLSLLTENDINLENM